MWGEPERISRMCKNMRPHVAAQMDVSEVASSGTGTVHGVIVGQVSPVKTSKKRPDVKFFDGQIRYFCIKMATMT